MALDTDTLIERRRLKRRLGIWRIVAILALVAVVVVAAGAQSGFEGRFGPHVARMTLDGVMVEDRELLEKIHKVAEDDNAKALIVRIDSPGGTTVGGETIYLALREVAEKKPVVALVGTLGASAAYMAACASDRIYVRETSLTGSIGVLVQSPQIVGLLEKLGISMNEIKSSPLKAAPSIFQPIDEKSREAMAMIVNDTYAWFKDLVADRRKLKPEELAVVADGRIFTGRQALDLKLVDAIGGEREARTWLAAEKDIADSLPVTDIDKKPGDGLMADLVGSVVQKINTAEWLTLDGTWAVWHPSL